MSERPKFLIVDGSSLVHRSFFALPLLTSPTGEYTNAVYGFANMLGRILEQEKPERVAVCFDKSRHTFRTELYGDYKGQRAATPGELSPQFESSKQLLDAMGIAWEEIAGFEADDIIGTLAKNGAAADNSVLILTGDRDSFQLIDEQVSVIMTKKGITVTERWDKKTLYEHYGLSPAQMIDLKALMGDASDNIPGVPGIGEKTALKLLAEYHDLDTVLANIDNISGKALKAKLANGRESALMSRELATIDCNMAGLDNLDKYAYRPVPLGDNLELQGFYRRMGFSSFLKALADVPSNNPIRNAKEKTPEAANAPVETSVPEYTLVLTAEELAQKLESAATILINMFKSCCALADMDNPGQIYVIDQSVLLANTDWLAGKSLWGCDLKQVLSRLRDMPKNNLCDLALAAYLLDPVAADYLAHHLAGQYLQQSPLAEQQMSAADIAAYGVRILPDLKQAIFQKLTDEELCELYENIELPLMPVLAQMEARGIIVKRETLEELNREFAAEEAEHTAKIYELAGHEFNINSPKQLGEILFGEMGIQPLKKTKTGFSTSVEVLEQLAPQYEIAAEVLAFRSVSKLRSTYAEGLQALIQADGRLHTSFNQTVTATGRLSSTEPNLQNIPVRTSMGRKLRKAFWAEPGSVLLSADYSQIELRVLADISGDKVLQQSFLNNEDIHARTAAEVLGIPITDVTPEQRRSAKAVNFGIVYGISDYGLAQDLGITRAEAKDYIDAYLERYTKVREYMSKIVEEGRNAGFVKTLCGRKRWLPDLRSKNYNLRSFAERTALNTPIQGTAADIIKLAMIRAAEAINRAGLQSRMLLQVHDELIFEVPAKEQEQMQRLVREAMEGAFKLAVPLTVDMKIGPNWHDMQKQ